MEDNLENDIQLIIDPAPGHRPLSEAWWLQEFNKKGNEVGLPLKPWTWGQEFTASELRYVNKMAVNPKLELSEESKDYNLALTNEEEIRGILHPGHIGTGEGPEGSAMLSGPCKYFMIGSGRKITEFSLSIRKCDHETPEELSLSWGSPGFTCDSDFGGEETYEDSMGFILYLKHIRFKEIAELIKMNAIDLFEIKINRAPGFYSEFTPESHADKLKILSNPGHCDKIKRPENCKIEPPILGNNPGFQLTIAKRNILNLKQDLTGLDIEKLYQEIDLANYPVEKKKKFFEKQIPWPLWVIGFILLWILLK